MKTKRIHFRLLLLALAIGGGVRLSEAGQRCRATPAIILSRRAAATRRPGRMPHRWPRCKRLADPSHTVDPRQPGEPWPGKRVAVTTPEDQGTQVDHQLYLPPDWDRGWKSKKLSWPVIVEYAGNLYRESGSTGEVEARCSGSGSAAARASGRLLFVSADHQRNQLTWWGDEKATVEYAKRNVPRICREYGGDAKKVVLCGFSRGAIAVNYIGLYDDEIAKLWCGFMSHDHYDGEGHGQERNGDFPCRNTARLRRLASSACTAVGHWCVPRQRAGGRMGKAVSRRPRPDRANFEPLHRPDQEDLPRGSQRSRRRTPTVGCSSIPA